VAKRPTRGPQVLTPAVCRRIEQEKRRLARRLRILRASAGITQAEVEERTGLSERSLRKVEHARTAANLGTLVACCHAYGVSLRDLFTD